MISRAPDLGGGGSQDLRIGGFATEIVYKKRQLFLLGWSTSQAPSGRERSETGERVGLFAIVPKTKENPINWGCLEWVAETAGLG